MIGTRGTIARQQSDFYRDCYRKCLRYLYIEVVLMLILIISIIAVIYTAPVAPNYASSTTGKILYLNPFTG